MAQQLMKMQHSLAAQLAASTLIGLGGSGEAVAQHPLSLSQRGQDLFINVLGAVGKHQRQLSSIRKAGGAGAEQHGAQLVPQNSPSRLAGSNYFNTALAQMVSQFAKLSALAYAVKTFKSNEFAASFGWHVEILIP